MKKKKILGLALAGVTALTGVFMLSGCDLKKDDSTPPAQEQETPTEKTIAGISISASAVPKYVVKGRFDQAKIKAMVTYSDNSFEYVTVTEDMLSNADKAKVQTAGTHSITITYEGKTETISVKVVTEMELLQELTKDLLESDFTITTQSVEDGDSFEYVLSYDADNKVVKFIGNDGVDDYVAYAWSNGNYVYDIDNEDVANNSSTYKYQTTLTEYLKGEYLGFSTDLFAGTGEYSNPQVTIDSDNNYVYTVTWTNPYAPQTEECKFVYNVNGIIKDERIGNDINDFSAVSMYNASTSVTLAVPAQYKALESSAVEE